VENVGRYGPAALIATTIFILSSIPAQKLEGWVLGWDKGLHCIEYAILGAAVAHAFGSRVRSRWSLAVLLTALYGASDEVHQLFTPGRFADLRDLLADAIGAVIGVLAYLGALRWVTREEPA
jgi:VanZ family protein